MLWNPHDYNSHYQLALANRTLDDIERARQSFEACLRFAPNHPLALLGFAKVLAIGGDHTSAQEAIQKAREIIPESPRVRYAAGFAAAAAGKDAVAVAEFEKALSLEFTPRHVALRQLAIAYNSTGETAKALESITEAIQLDPINAEYHLVKGQILLSLNRPEESIASLSRCVNLLSAVPALGPPERMTLEMACVSLCQAHLVHKNVLESCNSLLQCVQINPASIPARKLASLIVEGFERNELSLDTNEKIGKARNLLAAALMLQGEPIEAGKQLKEILSLDEISPYLIGVTHFGLARLAADRGDRADALEHLQIAERTYPQLLPEIAAVREALSQSLGPAGPG